MLHALIRQGKSFSGRERNCCFLNLGERFANISATSGIDFSDDGRAIASVDWDHDGDLDLWIANRSGPQIRYLRNDVPSKHNFVSIRLQGNGTTTNRDAIGGRVELFLVDEQSTLLSRIRTLRAGEGFGSQSSKWLHFGLGKSTRIHRLTVRWPGGDEEEFSDVTPNGFYLLTQGLGAAQRQTSLTRISTLNDSKLSEPAAPATTRMVSAAQIPMPRLSYKTLSGQDTTVRRTAANESPTLISLWASWCLPCVAELNEWSERQDDLRSAGLEIVALAVDEANSGEQGSVPSVRNVIEQCQFPFPHGLASTNTIDKIQMVLDHLLDQHQLLAVPLSILLDKSGRVVAVYRGQVTADQLASDTRSLTKDPQGFTSSTRFPGRWFEQRRRLSPFDLAWNFVQQATLDDRRSLDDAIEYVQENQSLLKDHFHLHKLLVLIGNGHLARGQAQDAMKLYRDALRVNIDYVDAQNNLAWLLATHPDDTLRDASSAVLYAQSAVATAGDVPSLLDTLAATYAAAGRYDEAVTTAKKAIRIAHSQSNPQLASKVEKRLQLYKSKRPFRSP